VMAGDYQIRVKLPEPGRYQVWLWHGDDLGMCLSAARSEDAAVRIALGLLEGLVYELKARRLLITKAPDLPLGAA
jgi:hypothetical protein